MVQRFAADRASYPALNKAQVEKLKQLSLVSLGMESRVSIPPPFRL
jgi:hypothetical protein